MIDSQTDKLTEVEKYVAMKGFHQQLSVMRNAYQQQQQQQQQSLVRQPLLGNLPQQQIPDIKYNIQQQVGGAPSMSNSQVNMLQAHHHQNTLPPNLTQPHSSHPVLPTASIPSMQHTGQHLTGSTTPLPPPNTERHVSSTGSSSMVICLDSDSDSDSRDLNTILDKINEIPLLPTPLAATPHQPPLHIFTPPVPTSVPVAMVTPVLSHTSNPNQSSLSSSAPDDSAVANALAGFVHFQKNMCKDLSQHDNSGLGTAKLALNSLANTAALHVYGNKTGPDTATTAGPYVYTDTGTNGLPSAVNQPHVPPSHPVSSSTSISSQNDNNLRIATVNPLTTTSYSTNPTYM